MDNFNLNKYFKNQYLSEGDISSSDIMPHKLQSHPDIKILIDTLSNFLNLDIEQRLGSGGYNGRSGYYIRMPYELRYWGDESEKAANNAFVKANKLSNEYNFELYDFTDWEEEPGERTWPANIGLFIQEKTLNERENKLFRVSKPRFIKDKNNLNFLNVYMDYDLGPGGASIALGKETMTGQIRRESAAEAIRQMENIARKLEDKFNIEDIEVTDLENGKVNLFAVSDDFIEMDLKSELSTALLNEEVSKAAIMRQIKDAEEILDSGEANGEPLTSETEMLVQNELKRLLSLYKSVNEMDINDPILVRMRAAKDAINKKPDFGKEYGDAVKQARSGNNNDTKLRVLKKGREQLMRDMEQEAEPEGGSIADEYGAKLNRIEAAIAKLEGRKEMTYDQAIAEGKKIGNNSFKTRTSIVTAPGKTEDKEVIIDNINDLDNVTIRWRGANHHGNKTLTNLKFKQESEGDDDLFAISNDNKWLFIVDRDDNTGEIDWDTLIVDSRELEQDDGSYAVDPEDIVNEGEWTLDFGELDEAEKILKTMNSIKEDKPGLWDNIRAKKASGKSMAKKGSKAYKSAKKAGDKINKEDK
tara:strand:+ start:352 stop:2109 length:1758 start_codon:yes stop_codon:yes gene_type:complete